MRQAIEMGTTQDARAEVRRLFDLQAASRWTVARSTAAERRKKLQRCLSASLTVRISTRRILRWGRSADCAAIFHWRSGCWAAGCTTIPHGLQQALPTI